MRKCKIVLRIYAHARDGVLQTLRLARLRVGPVSPLCNATDLTSSRLLSFEWQTAPNHWFTSMAASAEISLSAYAVDSIALDLSG